MLPKVYSVSECESIPIFKKLQKSILQFIICIKYIIYYLYVIIYLTNIIKFIVLNTTLITYE